MKNETRILLNALRSFLDRDEVKNKMLTAVMPGDARLGNLSGKEVDIPLRSVFQGLTNKLSFRDMAKALDDNNDVVIIFIEELFNELKDYIPPTESASIPVKDKEKEVKKISKDLKVVDDSMDFDDDASKDE